MPQQTCPPPSEGGISQNPPKSKIRNSLLRIRKIFSGTQMVKCYRLAFSLILKSLLRMGVKPYGHLRMGLKPPGFSYLVVYSLCIGFIMQFVYILNKRLYNLPSIWPKNCTICTKEAVFMEKPFTIFVTLTTKVNLKISLYELFLVNLSTISIQSLVKLYTRVRIHTTRKVFSSSNRENHMIKKIC